MDKYVIFQEVCSFTSKLEKELFKKVILARNVRNDNSIATGKTFFITVLLTPT